MSDEKLSIPPTECRSIDDVRERKPMLAVLGEMQEGASTGFAEGLVRHEFRAVPAIDEAWRSLVGIAEEMLVIDFEVVPMIAHSTTEYLKLLPALVYDPPPGRPAG